MGMKGKAHVFMCGTPHDKCTGFLAKTNHGLEHTQPRAHGSPEQAFNCAKQYLLRMGFTQIGSRDFSPPDGGPVRTLTKKTRFGGRLRSGKEGQRNQPMGKRGGIIFTM
jgi:hypothetical protein